jgi:hypothetical protein
MQAHTNKQPTNIHRLLGECFEIRLAVEQVDEWLQNFLKLAPGHCEEPRINDALHQCRVQERKLVVLLLVRDRLQDSRGVFELPAELGQTSFIVGVVVSFDLGFELLAWT